MKAKLGQTTVEAWKVTRDAAPEAWVQALLDQKQLVWKKDVNGLLLRIPEIEEQHKGEYLGELSALRMGGVGAIIARVGDYLVQEEDGNLRVVTERRFLKDYKTLLS